jgi:di- and tripeptidase
VLSLEYAEDREFLFSASGDSTVRVRDALNLPEILSHPQQVWSTSTLTPIYVLYPYLDTGAGDLFSLAWSRAQQTIYIGCQNTSIQWYNLNAEHRPVSAFPGDAPGSASGTSTPRKAHKFFDSYPQYERKPADIYAKNGSSRDLSPHSERDAAVPTPRAFLSIPAENVLDSAHYGYIYCMALLQDSKQGVKLVTGSGDEFVKVRLASRLCIDLTESEPDLGLFRATDGVACV